MTKNLTHRFRGVVATGAGALAMLALGACSVQDSLLEQQQPQIILPSDVQSATGAIALYNGALGRFRNSLNGGNNNQEYLWNFEGLMTDEVQSADSFSQRNDADQRITQTNDGVLAPIYNRLQQSRGYARDAALALQQYAPDEKTKYAEMFMEIGFFEVSLGQAFCNGIPLGETVNGEPIYTAPLTNAEVFQTAITRLDTALANLQGNDAETVRIRNATLITKARALVDLGQFDAAAALVAGIPTDYSYLITYSATTQRNEWWQMYTSTHRYSVGDSLSPARTVRILNAIPFYSSNDPRIQKKPAKGVGLDTTTPFTELTNWGSEDPISLVNGLDARMIEAEAQLQKKTAVGYAAMNTILNDLRADPPTYGNLVIDAMPALPVPLTFDAAVDQFFREKAFWQYGRGERFSDLRRLMRQYNRAEDAVWPSGPYYKTGEYGDNVNFPVPDSEKSNPQFTGCIDRNA
jgi:hypothetical protein